MRVAILGAGAIGLGYTAVLGSRGHDVVLWSASGSAAKELGAGRPLIATGIVEGRYHPAAAEACRDAVAGAEAVVVAVPGYGHRRVLDELAPAIEPGQTVVISSHCSLSALYLSRLLAGRGVSVPIVAWATTVTTGQRTSPNSVHVSGLRKQLDLAVLPAAGAAAGEGLCRALFGDRFRLRDDFLAISLSNLNPPGHMANALCNFTRIEKGEPWANYDGITPSVGRLIEALDLERLAVARAFGVSVRTVQEHYRLSFDVDGDSIADMARLVHERRKGPPGPTSPTTRFVTEDVPYGLVPMVELGRLAGVDMPLHEAGIVLFSALYGRDFRRENDLLPELGLDRLDARSVHRLLREGWSRE